MHKMVIHLLDIVMCNGKIIKSEMFSTSVRHSDMHKFPCQKPAAADLTVWVAALSKISSKFHVLTVALHEYIYNRHTMTPWRISLDGNALHQNFTRNGKEYHGWYSPSKTHLDCHTQSGG